MATPAAETRTQSHLGEGSLRDDAASCVVRLQDAVAVRPEVTGGKGARLAQLTRAGFPVPPGFVVSADTYREHERRVAERLPDAWAEVQRGAPSSSAIGAIRAAIEAEPVADPLAEEIRAAYRRLEEETGAVAVAVRSSGTAEDMGDASFAGQHESFLNVRGAESVLAAVPRCWASLWTDWAVHYRRRTSYGGSAVALAVVVELQIDAEVAGVLFTANRVAADDGEMVVTAGHGLGDAIVAGQVTPDVFYIEKASLKPRRQVLADAGRACLDARQLRELAELGRRVEAFYGEPQDIEWAWAKGRLSLLQARPITGRAIVPAPRLARGPHAWYRRFLVRNLGDHFPDPLRPLDFTTTIRAMFVGIREVLGEAGIESGLPEQFFPVSPRGEVVFAPPLPRLKASLLTFPFRLPRRASVDVRRVWMDRDAPYVETRLETLRRLDVTAATDGGLASAAAAAQDLLEDLCRRRFRHFVPGVVHAVLFRMLTRLAAGARAARARTVLLGGIDHRLAALNAEIAGLAAEVAARPALRRLFCELPPEALEAALDRTAGGADFRARLKLFLEGFGARSVRGMLPMPSVPTWAEQPSVVLGLLQAIVRDAPTAVQPTSVPDESAVRAALQDRLRARLRRLSAGWLGLVRLFDASLDRCRGLLYVREDSLWQGEVLVAALRHVVLEIGRRLHARRAIAEPEDVFFLRQEEIAEALGGSPGAGETSSRVALRQAQFAAWEAAARSGQDWVDLSLGLAPRSVRGTTSGDVLSGLPASPGVASGPVKLVLDQAQFHRLQRGDVLVCPVTTPAWTPLFSLAAAVVTDIGGPLSHAANVARENGIPAVLGTRAATRVLHDGEAVVVDGTTGRVSRAGP